MRLKLPTIVRRRPPASRQAADIPATSSAISTPPDPKAACRSSKGGLSPRGGPFARTSFNSKQTSWSHESLWRLASPLRRSRPLRKAAFGQARRGASPMRRTTCSAVWDSARREFTSREVAYDTALVALELAVFLIGEAETLSPRADWRDHGDIHGETASPSSKPC